MSNSVHYYVYIVIGGGKGRGDEEVMGKGGGRCRTGCSR